MKFVVTGATSMIGVALIECAIKNGHEVLAIVRPNSKRLSRLPKNDKLKVKYCSLDELDAFDTENNKYDVFYHFAWSYTSKEVRDNPELQEQNIKYTLDAVKLAAKLRCKKFIGAGSQAEFGLVDDAITENTPCNPETAYGMAKYSAFLLSKKMCKQNNIDFVWPRICSAYGFNDNDGTMLNYAMDRFKNHEIANFSSGKQIWNYIFEDDAGEMFYRFGSMDVEENVLVASDENKPLKEYVEQIAEVFNTNKLCKFADESSINKQAKLNVNASHTFEQIGFVPKVKFADGIKKIKNKL